MKTLVIAGGTGFLGESLARYFKSIYDEIVILSRGKKPTHANVIYIQWDAAHLGDWTRYLEGAAAVINLCGKNVNCRYTEKNKAEVFSSRLNSTAIIGKAIAQARVPPLLWINAASAAIYQYSEDRPMTESDAETGEGFSVEVCKAWEHAFNSADTPATRKLILRTGIVFGNEGGVYPVLLKLVKFGLGGKMGSGRQLVSWIHIHDYCRMVEWLIDHKKAEGAYNCTAPHPVSNTEQMQLMRKSRKMLLGLPATEWMLEIGAFFMRTETELILKGMNAVPYKAMQGGFTFEFETMESCINDLMKKK